MTTTPNSTNPGRRLRSDLIDVYVFRRTTHGIDFLQLFRAQPPLNETWQPVMGHIEPGESAVACALRELHEELALSRNNPAFLNLWALQEVHPYFLASSDSIMLSPRFAAEVTPTWTPTLNEEHTGHRWVPASDIDQAFLWPGQRAACREVLTVIVPNTPASEILRLNHRL